MATNSPHHPTHLADIRVRPRLFAAWEKRRHRQAHWFVECFAEALGVFFYCYAGIGSQASFVIGNILGLPGVGSLYTVGFAYSLGIGMAITVCSATSGGHFNPAVTTCFVLFKGFPIPKAFRYMVSQVLGGFIACMLIYLQWRHLILEAEGLLASNGTLDAINFTSNGPAGIFALYATPGSSLGQIWVNEFVVDFFIGLTIWACLDPTNFAVSPVAAPWIIGFAYGVAVWGYSPVGLAANAARDVGARMAALCIWGLKASGGRYAAIAALTNIPATVLAYCVYELILVDSSRVITPQHQAFLAGHQAHMEHSENLGKFPRAPSDDLEDKAQESRHEK